MIPQLQTNSGTFYGRYFTETQVLRRYFPADADLKILSFGCSTGEELKLLSRLFPNAKLYGCDHDWTCLVASRALMGAAATVFDSTSEMVTRFGPFDIVVCNSVLLSPTVLGPKGMIGLMPERWLQMVTLLDSVIAPSGVLQLINSNFPFRLHPEAMNYTALRSPLLLGSNFADQFALDGRKLCTGIAGGGLSAHIHVHLGEADWSLLKPDDLTDTHFQKRGPTVAEPVGDQTIPNIPAVPTRATGETIYRPQWADDPRPASFQTVKLAWRSIGYDGARISRTVTRTWFDGMDLEPVQTEIDIQGPLASAFIEGQLGRVSSRIFLSALDQQPLIHSPLF